MKDLDRFQFQSNHIRSTLMIVNFKGDLYFYMTLKKLKVDLPKRYLVRYGLILLRMRLKKRNKFTYNILEESIKTEQKFANEIFPMYIE